MNLEQSLEKIQISDVDRNILIQEIVINDMYNLRNHKNTKFDFVIDIGANVGIFSLCFRYFHPESRIIAIEPFKDTYEMLIKNTQEAKIETINAPFGDGSNLLLKNPNKGNGGAQCWPGGDITSWTLLRVFKEFNLNVNDNFMIKCDCEGSERYLTNKDNIDIVSKSKIFVGEFHIRHKKEDLSLLTEDEMKNILNSLNKTHKVVFKQYPNDEFMFYVFSENIY